MASTVKSSVVDGARINRAQIIDKQFIETVNALKVPKKNTCTDPLRPVNNSTTLCGKDFLQLFESQMASRQLDLMARALRLENKVFYTIGSSGHEGNAVPGRLLRHTDPAFLHYRSGAFMAERSRKIEDIDFIYDTALSLAASKQDPASGGRHKVWGSKPLWVLPQTSTIASHLPKAVGTALGIIQARLLKLELPIPEDSIVVCSFGDASTNHSSAQGAFNVAQWSSFQRLPAPILFVCEDNGIGVSTPTPPDWIKTCYSQRPGLKYFFANGLDLCAAYDAVKQAIDYCRNEHYPVFLHLKVTRLMGHAGTDFELVYRDLKALERAEAEDPLLCTARIAVASGLMTPRQILAQYEGLHQRCLKSAAEASATPRLQTRDEVIAPQAPYTANAVQAEAARHECQPERIRIYGKESALPENQAARHLAININKALSDLLIKYPQSVIFGEDVGKKGGVYTVTSGLGKLFSTHRVFNTLLDEQTILGLAQGYANLGILPIPEIQYLAFYHNACDQIRGEAASLQFFSNNQFQNPMVIRIAGLGYQKGFGGHFHNDNSIAALRDIPGLVIACPSRGDDAAMMLRTLMALAIVDGRVSIFLEPIALYMEKDLYQPGDEGWLFPYPSPEKAIPFGQGRAYNKDAKDLLIISYANGVLMSLRAAREVEQRSGQKVRVLDLRWLQPLNIQWIIEHVDECKRVLIVDEARHTGSVAEGIAAAIMQECREQFLIRTVTGADSYTPLGPAAASILPSNKLVVEAALKLLVC